MPARKIHRQELVQDHGVPLEFSYRQAFTCGGALSDSWSLRGLHHAPGLHTIVDYTSYGLYLDTGEELPPTACGPVLEAEG